MDIIKITDIDGFLIGNAEKIDSGTGVTTIISKSGATPGVDVRGGSPGTRETDLIASEETIDKIHSVVLAGGSAFGLDAASGVMTFLEEKDIGFDTGYGKVPIVSSAIIFDLDYKGSKVRPDKNMGYLSAQNAFKNNYKDGPLGVGAGATIGKILGYEASMKSGVGSFAIKINNLEIGAIIGLNALGSIYENNTLIGGPILDGKVQDTFSLLVQGFKGGFPSNTTIGAVLTNGDITKAQANKVASSAHNGLARSIKPVHTSMDGDTLFVLSSNKVKADINVIQSLSAYVVEKAVINAFKSVVSDDHLKCFNDFK